MELDQFMKEVMTDFPEETIGLFFPHLARYCDFSQMKELNKDFYTESPKGSERFVDVLLEVGYKNPPPSNRSEDMVLIVHVESQQQKRFDFPARMLAYQNMIYEREIERYRRDSFTQKEFTEWENRKRILSFVFCNYTLEDGIKRRKYKTGLPESNLGCRYTCISLPVLSAKEYVQKDNPVVCALAVFMDRDGLSKPELKVAGYRKLLEYRQDLTTRQVNLIIYALETYLTLTKEEDKIYQKLIKEIYPEVNKVLTNPLIEQGRQQGIQQGIQQGRQQGIQQGRQQGIQQGKQLLFLQQLHAKFGELPAYVEEQVQAISEEKLEQLSLRILTADTLEEMGLNGKNCNE